MVWEHFDWVLIYQESVLDYTTKSNSFIISTWRSDKNVVCDNLDSQKRRNNVPKRERQKWSQYRLVHEQSEGARQIKAISTCGHAQ